MIGALLEIFRDFWWLGIVSLAAFFLTILILPVVIVRLPEDYFVRDRADGFISRQSRALRLLLLILKNLAGAFLLIMGIIMLFVPGQGILTILAGLSVMNFPGKRGIELRLASNRKVMGGLNWIREKGHRSHFHEVKQVIS
ncbi:MAG: hypothetical protein JXR86_08840 [Spirochaetales bacterium]|nr:hypothetical protein [Spirochaetales bacterium]